MALFHPCNSIADIAIITCAVFLYGIGDGAHAGNDRVPSNKEILTIVFSLSPEKLSSQLFCNNVGTSFEDSTIGQYLSGFWEAHADTCGENFIKTEIISISKDSASEYIEYIMNPEKSTLSRKKNPRISEDLWQVDFQICKRCDRDNERWCWGIRFLMKQSDHTVIPGTVWCIGAG